jgi:hypothetical protein
MPGKQTLITGTRIQYLPPWHRRAILENRFHRMMLTELSITLPLNKQTGVTTGVGSLRESALQWRGDYRMQETKVA